jgi:hypothetical protein
MSKNTDEQQMMRQSTQIKKSNNSLKGFIKKKIFQVKHKQRPINSMVGL